MLEDDSLFQSGRRVFISAPQEAEIGREVEIELFRRQHGRCVAKFRGIDTITDVEQYIGSEIRIAESTLPPPQDGWFYTFHLKGCRVVTMNGEEIGIVTDVLDSGGAEVLKVDRQNRETLIPFADEFVKKIDIDQRKIEVDLPEDLRELNK